MPCCSEMSILSIGFLCIWRQRYALAHYFISIHCSTFRSSYRTYRAIRKQQTFGDSTYLRLLIFPPPFLFAYSKRMYTIRQKSISGSHDGWLAITPFPLPACICCWQTGFPGGWLVCFLSSLLTYCEGKTTRRHSWLSSTQFGNKLKLRQYLARALVTHTLPFHLCYRRLNSATPSRHRI